MVHFKRNPNVTIERFNSLEKMLQTLLEAIS